MGNEIISRELLSDVLEVDVYTIIDDKKTIENNLSSDLNGDYIAYRENSEHGLSSWIYLNIHELAHKCKEWAKNKGYIIGVDLDKVNIWSIKEREVINYYEVYWEDYLEFEFKACQWILESKKD